MNANGRIVRPLATGSGRPGQVQFLRTHLSLRPSRLGQGRSSDAHCRWQSIASITATTRRKERLWFKQRQAASWLPLGKLESACSPRLVERTWTIAGRELGCSVLNHARMRSHRR